ncbi:MAG: sugar transferase [Gammaproteobacteria bacterium]|nr:MAG: sugar transferase [Gammaproteobacteria bacterium]
MILIGEKYKFTELETQRLKNKFANIKRLSLTKQTTTQTITTIEDLLKSHNFAIIVLNIHQKTDKKIIQFLTDLKFNSDYSNLKIITIEHFLEEYLEKCYIPQDNTDLHYLDDIKGFNLYQKIAKRIIDYFGVFWLFFFSWLVMIKCRFKIKKQSPGEILFKQKRVGLNNKEFVCIKFRSMNKNTEFFNHYTKKDDPRIFAYGKIMRSKRYDELPQMWNILKGDMHLIGPRAEWVDLVAGYQQDIPYYNIRHLIAPGITGHAQVMYPYGESAEDARQKLMYDLYYIKHWSIWLEFKTVIKTALVVVNKKGL